jgi:hypothetical protein
MHAGTSGAILSLLSSSLGGLAVSLGGFAVLVGSCEILPEGPPNNDICLPHMLCRGEELLEEKDVPRVRPIAAAGLRHSV